MTLRSPEVLVLFVHDVIFVDYLMNSLLDWPTENWKHTLLEVIDADQLPVHWGGTATDPDGDPCCRSKVGKLEW